MAASIFAGLTQANITETGSYLPGGYRFKLRIDKCQIIYPRSNIPAFVVDFTVLESNCPDVKPQEVRNWYQKTGDSFDSAVLAFLAGAFGFNLNDPAQKAQMERDLKPNSTQYAEAACGPTQILAGRIIGVETQKRDTRSGGDFTRHNWFPAA